MYYKRIFQPYSAHNLPSEKHGPWNKLKSVVIIGESNTIRPHYFINLAIRTQQVGEAMSIREGWSPNS